MRRVLAIGGSDSSGGAGIQADIKTITALGAYAATAITAITSQDTARIHAVHAIPPALIAAQLAAALADPGADAIKTGMLVDGATVAAIAAVLAAQGRGLPLVIDPVLLATSGAALLADTALPALRALFAHAALITPNIPEAAHLSGHPITTLDDMRTAARLLLATGAEAVLIKGAHRDGETITDLLVTPSDEHLYTHLRQHTRSGQPGRPIHGTGCTLAAAIATFLAQSRPLPEAVARATTYLQHAIAQAPPHGVAQALLNHAVTVAPYP